MSHGVCTSLWPCALAIIPHYRGWITPLQWFHSIFSLDRWLSRSEMAVLVIKRGTCLTLQTAGIIPPHIKEWNIGQGEWGGGSIFILWPSKQRRQKHTLVRNAANLICKDLQLWWIDILLACCQCLDERRSTRFYLIQNRYIKLLHC